MHDRVLRRLTLAYAAAYAALCLLRFFTFHAQIDMSYYLRLVWGLGSGHPDLPLVRAPHWLGLHLEPVLLPLGLLARLGVPLAPLLLLVQAGAVALLAWPAYRMGERHLGPGWPARGAALCALLYPTVSVATLHDFHPVTLALPALLGVLDALDEGRPRRALLLGALALGCREDIALQLALLALLYAARPALLQGTARGDGGAGLSAEPGKARGDAAERGAALALALGLLAYFFAYVLLVQVRFLPPDGSYNLHFANVGGDGRAARSAPEVLRQLLAHPLALLSHLGTAERLLYPLRLLWPVALLSLLRPAMLAGALPILAINLLSDFPRVRSIEAHYATAIVPFVLGAALQGAGALRAWLLRAKRPPSLPSLALLACAALAHLLHGGSPLALLSSRFSLAHFRPGPNHAALRLAAASAPPQVSVAARPGLLAHLAERPRAISPPEYDDGKPVAWASTLEP